MWTTYHYSLWHWLHTQDGFCCYAVALGFLLTSHQHYLLFQCHILQCHSDICSSSLLPERIAPDCPCMCVRCRISARKHCRGLWLSFRHGFVLQIVSTMGTARLEDVAEASKGSPLLIFQLYVQRDRDFTASLLRSRRLLEPNN